MVVGLYVAASRRAIPSPRELASQPESVAGACFLPAISASSIAIVELSGDCIKKDVRSWQSAPAVKVDSSRHPKVLKKSKDPSPPSANG